MWCLRREIYKVEALRSFASKVGYASRGGLIIWRELGQQRQQRQQGYFRDTRPRCRPCRPCRLPPQAPQPQFLGRRLHMLLLIRSTTQFLVRRGQICSIAKEDPHGIVQIVQPVGSYFWDRTKMCPLSQEIYKKLLVEDSAETSILSGRFGKKSNPVHSSIWSTETA